MSLKKFTPKQWHFCHVFYPHKQRSEYFTELGKAWLLMLESSKQVLFAEKKVFCLIHIDLFSQSRHQWGKVVLTEILWPTKVSS